jgi:hypothetical protein
MRYLISTFLFPHYLLYNKLLRSKYINISIYKHVYLNLYSLYLPTLTSSAIIVHLPCRRIHPSIMYMYIAVSSTYLVFEKSSFQNSSFLRTKRFGRQMSSRIKRQFTHTLMKNANIAIRRNNSQLKLVSSISYA